MPRATIRSELLLAACDPPATTPERVGGTDDARQPQSWQSFHRLLHRRGDRAGRHLKPSTGHRRAEQLAVLRARDRLVVGADQLDLVALERAVVVQRLERGSARSGRRASPQQRVGALARDHLRHRTGQQRLDVGRVGELRVGHDRRRVGVDEHDLDSPPRAAPCRPAPRSSRTRRPARSRSGRSRGSGSCGCHRAGALRGLRDPLKEAVEQIQAVVRTRARLGVVLDGPARQRRAARGPRRCGRTGSRARAAAAPKSVCQRTGSSALDRARAAGPERREAVVLGGDLDASGLQVLDGVVGAVVAERQLERLAGRRRDTAADDRGRCPTRAYARRCSRTVATT